MPHYIYLGDTDTMHPKLGLLKPHVSFEVAPDLEDEADAMVDTGEMERLPDEAPKPAQADEPEFLEDDDDPENATA